MTLDHFGGARGSEQLRAVVFLTKRKRAPVHQAVVVFGDYFKTATDRGIIFSFEPEKSVPNLLLGRGEAQRLGFFFFLFFFRGRSYTKKKNTILNCGLLEFSTTLGP